MSCNCKLYHRRFEKLQKKYVMLKKHHKKLLGVTILLTEALEEFVKGEMKTGINDTLSTCYSIYPDLFNEGNSEKQETDVVNIRSSDPFIQRVNESEKMFEATTESEKEYYEGFMARPKIPRTPQV